MFVLNQAVEKHLHRGVIVYRTCERIMVRNRMCVLNQAAEKRTREVMRCESTIISCTLNQSDNFKTVSIVLDAARPALRLYNT